MYEKELQAAQPKNPVHETCDITIKNLSNLSMVQCVEVVNHLKEYLADRKQVELNKLKSEMEELEYRAKNLSGITF